MTASPTEPHVLCAGLTTFDVVQLFRGSPAWGMKATAEESYADVGGPAANAAVTVALLGGRARLVTAIGSGAVADVVRSRLEQLDVPLVDLASAEAAVPVSSIWIDRATGRRTVMSTDRGSVTRRAPPDTFDAGTAALLVDGHHAPVCEDLVRRAAGLGIPVVVDGGSWKLVLDLILPYASVAILSADFKRPGRQIHGIELARAVRDQFGVTDVAITRGPEPVLSLSGSIEEEIPVPSVEAVDTLGAGDVFHGAYVFFRYLRRRNHVEALREAARVASQSCVHIGARAGVELIATGM
jgi:sugar/nucleoside kinase (ribokinase family)